MRGIIKFTANRLNCSLIVNEYYDSFKRAFMRHNEKLQEIVNDWKCAGMFDSTPIPPWITFVLMTAEHSNCWIAFDITQWFASMIYVRIQQWKETHWINFKRESFLIFFVFRPKCFPLSFGLFFLFFFSFLSSQLSGKKSQSMYNNKLLFVDSMLIDGVVNFSRFSFPTSNRWRFY